MSLKKQIDAKKQVCKVTFTLTKEMSSSVNRANLAGDFNDWNIDSIPMKQLKGGEFSVSIDLKKGAEYQYKYFIDGNDWLNDIAADKYVENKFQTENSVVIV
jgi:1,4-alpha-glucan branching enzyme